MKDEKGLFYYPDPGDHKERMYVRKGSNGEIEFRLWDSEHPEVWEQHEWLSYEVLKKALELYRKERNAKADHLALYDMEIAKALLKEV